MLLNRFDCLCEICGEPRNKRVHSKCSRLLQQRYDPVLSGKINAAVRKDELIVSMRKAMSVRINGRTKE